MVLEVTLMAKYKCGKSWVFNITNLERMQIKSTRCHLTPVRMATLKKQNP